MTSPKDNTEVIRMLRDVKNSIWKSLTPMKSIEHDYKNYVSGLKGSVAGPSHIYLPNTATKLNFSGLEDSRCYSDSSSFLKMETPDSLKRKLVSAEVELQASQAKLKERESLISVMEPANKKICLSLESKLEECRKQNEIDSQKIEELQAQLRWAKKQAASAKSQLHEFEYSKKVDRDQLEMKLLAIQQECSNLKVELADVKSEKTEAVRKLNMEIGKLELKVSMLTEEAEKSQSYIDSLKKKNSDMAEQVALCNTLQKELIEANDRIKTLENKIEADKDAALIVASRQSDLNTLNELQKENRIMKEELSQYKENNIALYQEKMWSMQQKLTQAEQKCVAVAKLQVENEQLKMKLNQWENLFDDKSTAYKSPTSFSRRLSQYQQNEAVLTNKLSQLSSYSETLEKQMKEKENEIKSLNYKLQISQDNLSRQDSVIKRLQRKAMFLSKEKDHCRKALDSYLAESTISGVAMNSEEISHLEEMNMEYKNALEKVEKEVDILTEKLKQLSDSHGPDDHAIELRKLKEENVSLKSQIVELQKDAQIRTIKQQEMVKTDTSSASRILHMRFNPLDDANQRHFQIFQKLKEENDVLRKRVQVLEEEGSAAGDVTMKVKQKLETEGADSTLQTLREQLQAAERQRRYILDNARIKATEFREAVYQLTGYRIDVPTSETFKLSHVYANSRDDYLLFKVNAQGILLIETEYSKQLTEQMQLYLHKFDSFPAFLANLTMELFNQQTFMLEQ
ncbi:mitotic spindle assembly checkpoint protein MAD1 [Parasteatoda tepidariorum]|uniref:mitotic spindle assembly checkpoint protein MAD1 n=1 Tax=Parasteatoda tepidariorum TaxID=114398 RepID=UPI00077FA302|nr:mitotic spindle assembly checkpoint protein MAD1 [Parasteatoda tepidariorum]